MLLERLKSLRRKVNLSQQEIAQKIHITREAYSMYENGHRQPPYEILIGLARYYHVSVDYLLGITDFPQPVTEITEEELQMLKQFRLLDSRGKQATLTVLQFEYHHQVMHRAVSSGQKKPVSS